MELTDEQKKRFPFTNDLLNFLQENRPSDQEDLLDHIETFLDIFSETSVDIFLMELYGGQRYLPYPDQLDVDMDDEDWNAMVDNENCINAMVYYSGNPCAAIVKRKQDAMDNFPCTPNKYRGINAEED